MPLIPLKSMSAGAVLEDAAADLRAARRVGQYRVGAKAAYFPAFPGTRYLPFEAVERAWSKSTAVTVKGCCGKELPMIRVRLFYDGEFYQDLLLENLTEANAILDLLSACCPDTPIQRETAARRAV